jgi:hypothetical protein
MPSKNPEVLARAQKKWRAKNPDYLREWRAANPDKTAKYNEGSYERRKEQYRAYYHRNREACRAKQSAYRKAHPEKAAERQLKEKHGMSMTEKRVMWLDQDKKCKICKRDVTLLSAHVDHIHGTQIIRGLLCGSCNRGLGLFQDDHRILIAASEYLRPFQILPEINLASEVTIESHRRVQDS